MIDTPGGSWFQTQETGRQLMQAVMEIYDAQDSDGHKPAAEHWTLDDEYFAENLAAIKQRWGELTGLDSRGMPFTVSFVRLAWITYRKMTDESKKKIREWVYEFTTKKLFGEPGNYFGKAS